MASIPSSSSANPPTNTNKSGRPILATLFDLAEYDSDDEHEKYPIVPSQNLASAAVFITELFSRHGVPVAVIGGLAMALYGAMRGTRDVDIVFEAPRKFAQMWNIIDQESRLIIPKQRTVADVAKIFVRTGGEWDDCALEMPIEVDLIQAGSYNTPLDLQRNRTLVEIEPNKVLYPIAVFYLLKAKIDAYYTREAIRDRDDINFLVDRYERIVEASKGRWNLEKVGKVIESLSGQRKAHFAQLFDVAL